MSTPQSSPAELALGTVLHQAATGQTTATLLALVVAETRSAMGQDTLVCAIVLGGSDMGLAVHASTAAAGTSAAPPVELLLTGPALTTATTGAVSTIDDAGVVAGLRWPAWAEGARATGVVGVRCWPVQVAHRPVGALLALTSGPWSAPTPSFGTGTDLRAHGGRRSNATGQAMADVCSVVLQLPPPARRWEQVASHLRTAVEADVVVHQAVGMVAAAHDTDISTAAAGLAAHAAHLDVDVTDLARDVVARTTAARDVPAG